MKNFFTYGERIQSTRDWYFLLKIAGVLLALGVCWSILLFVQFQNQKGEAGQAIVPTQQNLGDTVTQVQTLFQQRATEEGKYQKTYHFTDPSR